MRLIPFHKSCADFILEAQVLPENRRFFRGLERYLKPEEAANFDKFFEEVFIVVEKDDIIGLATIKKNAPNVYELGVLVTKEFQKKSRGTWIALEVIEYLFHVKHAHKIMIMVSKGHGLNRVVEEDLGFKLVGCFEKHTFVNGEYEDLFVYEKLR